MIVCPDNCEEGHRKRQSNLTEYQLEEISEAAQKAVRSSKGIARRCGYCGCVYLNESDGQHVLGYLDGGVSSKGWSSTEYQ